MLRADAVVDAVEPGLQIGEDEVDHRHELFGHFGVAAFGNCMVVEAPLAQAGIAAPIVGDDQRAWHDGTLDKATQGIGAAVSSDGQSHSTGIAAILPLVLCRARLPVANLDSGGHQRFVVDAPAFAARPSTDPRLIDLDMFFRPTTDAVLVRTHHARAQFVQDAEGSFVSCQPKLPLKLHRRHARRLAGDEVRGPEPDAERRMAAFHDGADQETGLAAARTALQNTRSGDNAEGLGDLAAIRADKAVRPAGTPKIGSARRVIGKQLLKLRERSGESQIVALVDVHSRHDGQTLALVGVCVNRIGMVWTSRTAPASRRYAPPYVLRVVVPWIGFDGLLDTAFEQIRHYGKTDIAVSLRLLRAFDDMVLAGVSQKELRSLIDRARRVVEGCELNLPKDEVSPLRLRLAKLESRLPAQAL